MGKEVAFMRRVTLVLGVGPFALAVDRELRSATGLRAKLLEEAWCFGVGQETISGRLPQSGRVEAGNLHVETQGEYRRRKSAFVSQALREEEDFWVGCATRPGPGRAWSGSRRLRWTFRHHAGCTGNPAIRRSLHGRLYRAGRKWVLFPDSL